MELTIIEETPKKLTFELRGEGHTLCNTIKWAMWANKHVKTAVYNIDHPLVGVPKMVVETDGEVKPKKAILEAVEKLQSESAKLKKEFSKIK